VTELPISSLLGRLQLFNMWYYIGSVFDQLKDNTARSLKVAEKCNWIFQSNSKNNRITCSLRISNLPYPLSKPLIHHVTFNLRSVQVVDAFYLAPIKLLIRVLKGRQHTITKEVTKLS